MVPPVTMVSDPGNVPAATPMGTTMGNCASWTPTDARRSPFHVPNMWRDPSDAVTAVSMAGQVRQGIGGHGLAGPVAPSVRDLVVRPAEEPLGIGHGAGQKAVLSRRLHPTLAISVEKSGQNGDALAVHRREGGHHGRDGHSGNRPVTQLVGHLLVGLLGPDHQAFFASWRSTSASGATTRVRHTAASDDLSPLVDGQRLDRCGAHVDADGDCVRIGLMNLTRVS